VVAAAVVTKAKTTVPVAQTITQQKAAMEGISIHQTS
tara:strand:+ start:405 stop:515 length:111 start_codon:yes stop_codon:yes gene_type:complete